MRARLVREREYASEVFFEGVGYAASEACPRERIRERDIFRGSGAFLVSFLW